MTLPQPRLPRFDVVVGSLLLFLSPAAATIGVAELALDSDFENGNGIVVEVDQEAGRITFSPERLRGSVNIWWHVRLTGVEPGRELELVVTGFDNVARECNPVFSYDRKTWHRLNDTTSPHRQTFEQSTVWIARNIPYTYTDSLELAQLIARDHGKLVQVSDLCTSEGGKAVKLLRITDPDTSDDGKQLIWLQARQHAFESHSSHVAEALAWWLCGDSDEATALRQQAIVCIVPVVDVDSVIDGGAGKNQQPVDFNRSWSRDSHWAAVRAVIELLDQKTQQHELAVFIDLHSPYYADSNHWYLPKPEALQVHAHAFARLYADTVKDIEGANHWDQRARMIDAAGSEDTRARNYATSHWLDDTARAVAMTMEVAHWTDGRNRGEGGFITLDGLRDYGRALGVAMARWLEEDA